MSSPDCANRDTPADYIPNPKSMTGDPVVRPTSIAGQVVVSLATNKDEKDAFAQHAEAIMAATRAVEVRTTRREFESGAQSWFERLHKGSVRSSEKASKGMISIILALSMCEQVDIYGYREELEGQPYHCKPPRGMNPSRSLCAHPVYISYLPRPPDRRLGSLHGAVGGGATRAAAYHAQHEPRARGPRCDGARCRGAGLCRQINRKIAIRHYAFVQINATSSVPLLLPSRRSDGMLIGEVISYSLLLQ